MKTIEPIINYAQVYERENQLEVQEQLRYSSDLREPELDNKVSWPSIVLSALFSIIIIAFIIKFASIILMP